MLARLGEQSGVVANAFTEARALAGQPIDVGRAREGMPRRTKVVEAKVVDHHEEDVRGLRRGAKSRAEGQQGQHRQREACPPPARGIRADDLHEQGGPQQVHETEGLGLLAAGRGDEHGQQKRAQPGAGQHPQGVAGTRAPRLRPGRTRRGGRARDQQRQRQQQQRDR